ncbi:uncharacterized protein BDZ83DRAFT_638934 [Colletotrichum acutatum]|uniref:Secreted protein n=1 Tax=Glomerella acutata TaxID=27357 RepID=A0AAD8UEJ3_GLOAC|nr:uncharacterized protein BDZ83DRAFT_638934 [Colletotrichum acutatum]KAK1711961.1 hypothetical protein BDZ83DRAFT_638934 [Colletotrichum acutatum]
MILIIFWPVLVVFTPHLLGTLPSLVPKPKYRKVVAKSGAERTFTVTVLYTSIREPSTSSQTTIFEDSTEQQDGSSTQESGKVLLRTTTIV